MTCDSLRERLAAAEPGNLAAEPAVADHLAGCAGCRAFAAALARLDDGFAALPARDAGDALVARTLDRVRSAAPSVLPPGPGAAVPGPGSLGAGARFGRRRLAGAGITLAAAAVLAVLVVRSLGKRTETVRIEGFTASTGDRPASGPAGRGKTALPEQASPLRAAPAAPAATPPLPMEVSRFAETTAAEKAEAGAAALGGAIGDTIDEEIVEGNENRLVATDAIDGVVAGEIGHARPVAPPPPPAVTEGQPSSSTDAYADADAEPDTGDVSGLVARLAGSAGNKELAREQRKPDAGQRDLADDASDKKKIAEAKSQETDDRVARFRQDLGKDRLALRSERASQLPADPTRANLAALDDARAFLAESARVKGLRFQSPTGYWANTYVPGDPAMRSIAARLRTADPAALALAESARRYLQPLDPPESAALALYLRGDQAAVEGPTRMLLQVGIKGALRTSASRPPMSIGVVLDLATVPPATTTASIRALLDALAGARTSGDRFFLVVAGRPGGLAVGPDEFRSGPLTVALTGLVGGGPGGPGVPTLSLAEALSLATATAAQGDDPSAPLGGSAVILVTASPLGAEVGRLCRIAHRAGVAGVPLSVVGVGDAAQPAEIDRLVLAGQGNRRLLGTPAEARALVDRELHAQSRTVARALRLRLRLAPKVQLVDVIGSYRLDRAASRRVKEAEQSIDRRLARSLGIDADRGKDEDGIQIVVPAFQAGDEHVLLLDVVVPGPGPVLEVTARYKDLVYLRNGVARVSLSLPAGSQPRGPLERNVLKNRIARRVGADLAAASELLGQGDRAAASQRLEATAALLAGLRAAVPGLGTDPEILADERLCHQAAALGADPAALAAALRYASFLKTNIPLPDGGHR